MPRSEESAPRWPLGHRILLQLGFAEAVDRPEVAFTSFAQIRMLLVLSATVALGLCYLLAIGMVNSGLGWQSTPTLTLFVLRSVPLLNGVSPLAPAFLAMACVYAWSVSRMARLYEVHALSRMALTDGLEDLVSTPIRAVPIPGTRWRPRSEGFTRTERTALNSILRPCTGPGYLAVLGANLFLPVVLAVLKPPSTLERGPETMLLFATIALCVVLIGATIAQLLQYWWALGKLLRRITAHPLRGSFSRVSPFARRSIDERISRTPLDLLRFAGAAVQFGDLLKSSGAPRPHRVAGDVPARRPGRRRRRSATTSQCCGSEPGHREERDGLAPGPRGARGGAANDGTPRARLRGKARRGRGAGQGRGESEGRARGSGREGPPEGERGASDEDAPGDDAPSEKPSSGLEGRRRRLRGGGLALHRRRAPRLCEAEEFVATVVTLLVERHVRQFHHFLYGLTACVLLLLAAFGSYSFEPHRLLLTCLWGVTGTVVVSGLYVFVGLDRNTLLSLVAGTAPGRVTLDAALVVRLATWVGVPLLGIAAAQYPEVANALGRLVEPFTHVLR